MKHQIWTETTVIVASSADPSLNAWTGDMRVIWFLNCYGSLSARIALNINVWTKSQMTESTTSLALALCYRRSSHVSSRSLATFCVRRRMNPLLKILALSKPSHGRRPPGRPQKSYSGNGSTPISLSQSMTSCALPKTELETTPTIPINENQLLISINIVNKNQ